MRGPREVLYLVAALIFPERF
ncbi:potassium-transporting ATPase subunit F [Kribbella sancticallisti]